MKIDTAATHVNILFPVDTHKDIDSVSFMYVETVKLTVKNAGLCYIPHSCSLHNVSNHEFLDCLVFRHTTGTVGATDGLDVPTSLLGTAVVPPLLGL